MGWELVQRVGSETLWFEGGCQSFAEIGLINWHIGLEIGRAHV